MTELTDNSLSTDFGSIRDKYLSEYNKETYHYGKKIAEQKLNELL